MLGLAPLAEANQVLSDSLCLGPGTFWASLHAGGEEEGCAGIKSLTNLLTSPMEEPG